MHELTAKKASIPSSLWEELGQTLKLSGPMILGFVGFQSLFMIDTLIAGSISPAALAGVGAGSAFLHIVSIPGIGLMAGLDPHVSQAHGRGDRKRVLHILGQAIWLSLLASGVFMLLASLGPFYFSLVGATPDILAETLPFVQILVWSIPANILSVTFQRFWGANEIVTPQVVIIVLTNLVHYALCRTFALGEWGIVEAMGSRGLGYATLISRFFMLFAYLAYSGYKLRPKHIRMPKPDLSSQKDLLRLGLPSAGQFTLEVFAFAFLTSLSSRLGAVPSAAHQVALTLASFTFMVPLGFGTAGGVRVGTNIGAGSFPAAIRAGWLTIALGCGFMTISGLLMWFFPNTPLGWFTNDSAVLSIGKEILIWAALFQLFDGAQVTLTGVLRGLSDTRSALIATLIGQYPVGIPLGLSLAFYFDMGVEGFWIGLASGLMITSLILLVVWIRKSKGTRSEFLV